MLYEQLSLKGSFNLSNTLINVPPQLLVNVIAMRILRSLGKP